MRRNVIAKCLGVFVLATLFLAAGGGCDKKVEPLVVFAGKGLKEAMEDVKQAYEQQHKIPVKIAYAGSNTLLALIKKTGRGDIYVPGSPSYIKKAGDLITADYYVGLHVPAFAVTAGNGKQLKSYDDLLQPGVRMAVPNKDMAALGNVGEAILQSVAPEESFRNNIIVYGSTVNDVLQLLVDGDVDAALVWTDMIQWQKAKGLQLVEIPKAINQPKEIRVGVLATSTSAKQAQSFAHFMSTQGQEIFIKHGFGKK